MFVPCQLGSEIEFYSHRFIEKLYANDWYKGDLSDMKNVVVLQTIMQVKPIKIRAGIFSVDLEMFLLMTQTVYSLIALVRHIRV